jgi:hypothetical protein
MHELADLTDRNKQGGTPWVTVNNKHSDEIQNRVGNNLIDLICSLYKVSLLNNSKYSFKLIYHLF